MLISLRIVSHVNLRAEDGATALMMAAQAGRGNCVQLLLDFGADVNIEVCNLLTPNIILVFITCFYIFFDARNPRLMTAPWPPTWPASPDAALPPCSASSWPRARRSRGNKPLKGMAPISCLLALLRPSLCSFEEYHGQTHRRTTS